MPSHMRYCHNTLNMLEHNLQHSLSTFFSSIRLKEGADMNDATYQWCCITQLKGGRVANMDTFVVVTQQWKCYCHILSSVTQHATQWVWACCDITIAMTMAARVTSIGNGEQTAIRKQWLDNGGQQLRTDQKRHTTKSTSHAGVVTHTCAPLQVLLQVVGAAKV